MKTSKLNDSFSQLFEQKLKKYTKEHSLNATTCTMIYSELFETLVEIFEQSNVKITNESMNYVAQMYYDSILINGNQELDPNIFNQRASLKNIETKELALLAMMFNHSDFATPFIYEIKHRS